MKINPAYLFAAFTATATPVFAQDTFDSGPVEHIAAACGTQYQTYRDGEYPYGINTYGAACIETTRDEIKHFFEEKLPEGLDHQPYGSLFGAVGRGAAWANLKRSCGKTLDRIDPIDAATPRASDQKQDGQYTGPFYSALNDFQGCLSKVQNSHASFGYAMPVNDFNFLAAHVTCLNDDGQYPNSTPESKRLCPQIESIMRRVMGFENL